HRQFARLGLLVLGERGVDVSALGAARNPGRQVAAEVVAALAAVDLLVVDQASAGDRVDRHTSNVTERRNGVKRAGFTAGRATDILSSCNTRPKPLGSPANSA